MHREARMYVARTAKEFGLAAAVAGFGYALPPPDGSDEAAAAAAAAAAATAATSAAIPTGAAAHHAAEEAARIRAQYASAPKAPFDLPDGTVVDLPVVDRFDACRNYVWQGRR